MITKHLTEEEIQQYAFDQSSVGEEINKHVLLCEECSSRVESYQLLFTGLKDQPQPVFDFDLSELILSQLPQPKPKVLPENFLLYLVIFIAIFSAGTVSYIFREYLLSLFAGITPFLIYLIGSTAIIILIGLIIDMYKNYQKKMNTLDFY